MDAIIAYFTLDSRGASEVRELGEEGVDCCTATDGLDAGDQRDDGLGGTDNVVISSSKRLGFQSTRRQNGRATRRR
jgi:hypothetical protein